MLILTRKTGETFMIGDKVTVTVIGVHGGHTRIGVIAPKGVAIHKIENNGKIGPDLDYRTR